MMKVEGSGFVVFCIDNQGVGGNFRFERSSQCVGEQCATQALASEMQINGQAPHAYRRYQWIAWQYPAHRFWEIGKQQARRCQGVITGNAPIWRGGNKTSRYPASNVLSYLVLKIDIQRLGPAIELLWGGARFGTAMEAWEKTAARLNRPCGNGLRGRRPENAAKTRLAQK